MKLTITLETENIMGFITELEAKGCYEVASAIEDAYAAEIALNTKRQIRDDFKKDWSKGYYFKHTNGVVSAIYFSYKNRQFHYGPLYVGGKLMGQPMTLHNIQELPNKLTEMGFVEV